MMLDIASALASITVPPVVVRMLASACAVAGVWLLAGVGWALLAAGALLVLTYRSAGMSTRAIGSALGISQKTADRDARESSDSPAPVVGLDGKTYTQPDVVGADKWAS